MTEKIGFPNYSRGEEIMNMVTHIVGGAFGIIVSVLCIAFAVLHHNTAGIVSGSLYGASMILVYTISSVYHGLDPIRAHKGKIVLRIIDHCDIYCLIVGTYAPIALTRLKQVYPVATWISFGVVCLTAVTGTVFTAIDLSKFKVLSYACYFVAGWSILLMAGKIKNVYSANFIALIIIGGAVYTLGMIFFVFQKKGYKYCHSVFHIFILLGSVIQFIPIFSYCI